MPITIKDVAKDAGLSIATISKYLNGLPVRAENRTRIEASISRLGFKVNYMARGLRTNKTMSIGILLPLMDNAFFMSFAVHIIRALRKQGYSSLLCDNAQEDCKENDMLDFLLGKGVDAIIMAPNSVQSEKILAIQNSGTPVILFDRPLQNQTLDTIVSDNFMGAYKAANHLIEYGHKRIGLINGGITAYTPYERWRGYKKALEEKGIPLQEDIILMEHGYDVSSGYRRMKLMLDLDDVPTAVLVTNDLTAQGAIMAINEANMSIPKDISLIAFDCESFGKLMKPKLTTINQPCQEMAEHCATLALRRINGDIEGYPIMLTMPISMDIGGSVTTVRK
ncbi:MAG: LacI family DNA-binding transcriptional regulator [Eubacteriales bacterium]|nr:LacI family DNA-binding transcriptional regulator [Eubacteriales bacterium]MDD3881568.1 LacI family DNA-binding transcriptional regulator [Eubacteriales bacterium]MDD4513362.1 LacI family DNA-binding transcriptional regulator [Eubacteriales bacterium]